MKKKPESFWNKVGRQFGAWLGIGTITLAPFAATVWIIYWLFINIDNILQPIIEAFLGRRIPGAGFIITILVILLVGMIASNVIGKRLIRYLESAIPFMPLFRQIYSGIKQILESFSPSSGTSRMQPVLVEFPRKGMKSIGFITSELRDENGKRLCVVFIPNSPNPTSGGFMQIVDEAEVTRTNISMEDAFKTIFSAGKVVPVDVADAFFSNSKPPADK